MKNEQPWWKRGVIYQIYPRSYQDSNGDGIGDLPGIIRRLDYVKSLNVDAVWLSPIFPSPMHDFGYDVSDYTGICPIFGTMSDFDDLLRETHSRGLKLLLDLVPNHTSDEHPWFLESRQSRENAKRDWYIWRDPAPGGGVPNNWLSMFGGSAWEWDEATGQYYLHLFVKQQPDLNYRNPDVLSAMLDNMRFWLDKGVDGFRVDVIWLMIKDARLRDEQPNPDWDSVDPYESILHVQTENQPEVHALIRQMRALLDSYADRMMVGEIYLPNDQLVSYYGQANDECHLPFNFRLINVDWNSRSVREAVNDYEAALAAVEGAWPNWVLGNHDQRRIAGRVGAAQARVAQMLLLTLRGTPTSYYGDELGMTSTPIPLSMLKDPPAVNQPDIAHVVGRDPHRTPMQWEGAANAGFTTPDTEPWLPVAPDFPSRNVAEQEREPRSMLALYRELTRLRSAEPALHAGDYAEVTTPTPEDVFAYMRSRPEADSFLVVLNLGAESHTLDLSPVADSGTVEISTAMDREGHESLRSLALRPDEGLVVRLFVVC